MYMEYLSLKWGSLDMGKIRVSSSRVGDYKQVIWSNVTRWLKQGDHITTF